MKRRVLSLLLVMALTLALAPMALAAEPFALSDDAYNATVTADSWQLLRMVNRTRMENGVSPLTIPASMQMLTNQGVARLNADGTELPTYEFKEGTEALYNVCYGSSRGDYCLPVHATPQQALDILDADFLNAEAIYEAHYYTHAAIAIDSASDLHGAAHFYAEFRCVFTGLTLSAPMGAPVGATLEELLENADIVAWTNCAEHGLCCLPVTAAMVSGYDVNGTGYQTVTVTFRDFTAPLTLPSLSHETPASHDFSLTVPGGATCEMTEEDWAHSLRMWALEAEYPEGTPWTNDNYHGWEAGVFSGGYGCAGFAMLLSDAAFGSSPKAHRYEAGHFTYDMVRPGTILRVKGNSHSVTVLEKYSDHVVVGEGNYNKSVHWGRVFTRKEVMQCAYIMTRDLPEGEAQADFPSFSDVPDDIWFTDPVYWAVFQSVTQGTGGDAFSPGRTCTDAEILTFLWRAKGALQIVPPQSGEPFYRQASAWGEASRLFEDRSFDPSAPCTRAMVVEYLWKLAGSPDGFENVFTDIGDDAPYAQAAAWAAQQGITDGSGSGAFSPERTCTRAEIVTFLYRAYH